MTTSSLHADTYLNLNRGSLSVRAASGPTRGKVWGYAEAVEITDAEFVVRESGRQRVIRERCKSVHAWVRGATRVLIPEGQSARLLTNRWEERCRTGAAVDVTYNPYYTPTFVERASGRPVHRARHVVIIGKRVFVVCDDGEERS